MLFGPSGLFAEIPFEYVVMGFAVLWAAVEARLARSGFVKKDTLAAAARECGLAERDQINGLGARLEEYMGRHATEIDVVERALIQVRADLDATRDRCTRTEVEQIAMNDRLSDQVVRPLRRIEETLTAFLQQQAHHDADISNLKGAVERIKGRMDTMGGGS